LWSFFINIMNKRILKLAIPNIISNITIPLLGMVDTALMGHLDSLIYIGAIALGSMIFNFIYWGMGFLRMGTVGFTGQANGAKNKKEVSLVLYRSLSIAIIAAVFLIIIHPFIINIGLSLTDSSVAIKNEAANYFNIRIWALPASLVILSFSGWFIGMQNTVYPMIISISSNLINIILSFIFVFGLDMKTEGVALGTVIAQYVSMLIGIGFLLYKYKAFIIRYHFVEVFNRQLTRLMNVNKDIFIRTLGIIFVLSFFTIKSANISDTTLAVNTILFQFFIFFSYLLDGFANAGEALSSKSIGARNLKQLKLVINKTFLFGLGFSFIFSLVYFIWGENIIRILTNNTDIINASTPLLFWVIILPFIAFPAFIYDGIYVGATASKAMRNTMVIASLFVFLPLVYLNIGNEITKLWVAFLAFLFSRGFLLFLSLKKSIYSLI